VIQTRESSRDADAAAQGGARATDVLAGKYMTFQLQEEDYGLPILMVREIIGLMEITRVPRVPDFVRGVINLRGRVIPVIDLRLKFGMAATAATEQTVIIVVQVQVAGKPLTMGVLVDRVLEVLNVEPGNIEPPPDLGQASIDGDFIMGVGKAAHRVVFLLDIARVLTGHEASALAAAAN
jgi:purine-binding chemotaxis protein CheW